MAMGAEGVLTVRTHGASCQGIAGRQNMELFCHSQPVCSHIWGLSGCAKVSQTIFQLNT